MPFYTNAFPKAMGDGYKPRLSQSEGSDPAGGQTNDAPKQEAQQQPQSPTSPSGRRRSSAASGDMFSGLTGHKRASIDHQARKNSFDEMKPGSQGVLAGMWNNFTKGPQK